jgi:tricorn protease
LIDGASVTAPSFAYYELDGTWGIEGHGVDPDIEVIDDPALMVDGGDPQLDAAIEHLLEELKTNAFEEPKRPAYPDRKKMGLPQADY